MTKYLKTWIKNNWPVLVITIFAFVILAYKIDKPFWGHHDWNGVYWGNVARNYVRYGLVDTKLGMVENVGLTAPGKFNYVFHYSPLLPIVWSLFWKVLGISEWSARLMSIVFSTATLLIYYLLVKKISNFFTAIVSCFLWIATPMFLYFGKMPVHEILVLFFSLTALYSFLNRKYFLTYILIALAELTSWPGYFIVPAITFFWLFNRRSTNVWKIVNLWLVSFTVFLSLLLHNQLLTGDVFGGGLQEIFFQRVRSVELITYVKQIFRWILTYYTPILLVAAGVGVIYATLKNLKLLLVLLTLFIFAIIYPIIFRDASFRHDYLLIYFLPFLAFAGGLGITSLNIPFSLRRTLAALVVFAMIFLRRDFIAALITSDIYKESVRIGKYVNSKSNPGEKVQIVVDPSTPGLDGWFISFYADRDNSIRTNSAKGRTPGKVVVPVP